MSEAQAVIELDEKRMKAMTEGDLDTLRSVIADELIYTHSSSSVDTKQSLIEKISEGTLNYSRMEPSGVTAQDHGDAVVLTGTASVQVVSNGNPLTFGLRFTDVYVKKGGNWQMVAWQSTRLPE